MTPDGQVIGASKIARDITERRRLERDARHFAAIVESSDDAIISKDLNGTIVSWNRAAERLFGYTAAEMVGQSIRLIIPPDRQSEEDHVLGAVRRGEVVDHFETVRLRKDGTPRADLPDRVADSVGRPARSSAPRRSSAI